MASSSYRGRFAPSPSGPLHFGSLVAAVASYADARHNAGEWLVRIEDVDQTRTRPDAERQILAALKAFGMHWDEQPVRQSERGIHYDDALQTLIETGHAYRCNCSRRLIATMARVGSEGPIYPGTCRSKPPDPKRAAAWRLAVGDELLHVEDRVVGGIQQNLAADIGDFVIRRIDGFTAYQLAVVVDDHAQGISDIVRGADLLWSTPRQNLLQRLLGYPSPRYAHIPLVYGADGHKLSKSDNAHVVELARPVRSLRAAWRHLGQQQAPADLDNPMAFWKWAIPRWRIERVPSDRNDGHERSDSL